MLRSASLIACTLACLLFAAAPPAGADESSDVQLLKDAGIDTSNEGLCQVLRNLEPSPELQKRIDAAIADLNARKYRTRQKATEALILIGQPAKASLDKLKDHEDLEVRMRVGEVLGFLASGEAVNRLAAVARVLGERKHKEAFEPLLVALKNGPDQQVTDAAERALAACVDPSRRERLRQLVADGLAAHRAVALRLLARVSDLEGDGERFEALIKDKSPVVKLAAAEGLARMGSKACLEPLLELLSHRELEVRLKAVRLLRQATGQRHKFVAYDSLDRRSKAADAWRAWVEGAKEIKINTDLTDPRGAHLGRLMYCTIQPVREVVELDPSGKKVWSHKGVNYPWGLARRENGNRLVIDYQRRRVLEFNPAGKQIWAAENLPFGAMGLTALPNGNVMLASTQSSQLIEISAKTKKQVRTIKLAGARDRPVSVQLLENGRYLVALQSGEVCEVDDKGKKHWTKNGLGNPMSARRLPSGNTLVVEMSRNRVIEINPAGKTVWTSPNVPNPYDAARLPNGNTLVGGRNGLVEIAPNGREIKKHAQGFVTRLLSW